MSDYEKLGAFYLGRTYDIDKKKNAAPIILYDAKDLTTHAVIIGMTGSGKTGLGIGLLEEALIDHIPVIAIDPKGDLANLALQFPSLSPEDFKPWVNPQEAASQGMTVADFATAQADLWEKGLAQWDQDATRIARLKEAAEVTVYTPGSSAGRQVSVLRNFSPPKAEIANDADLLRDQIRTTVTGLLTLLGIEADPLSSREHILLANIFEITWAAGKGLDLAGLIQAVQSPPFERVGVMDLEFFYPGRERMGLAMRLNNLLAAPGFESWMGGDPLDINRLLYTPSAKPRAAIFSIQHLADAERMFFVSTLLSEVLGWIRTQPGTTSLRAILYMDEIFGFFPPVANPPSKAPLLTLLKQARAFGLGVVLATQNPVDLDYKGLSNAGTWFIGRLQTEQDKERVIAGLEGAAGGLGDRARTARILSALGKRVFYLHNVHDTVPTVFETRWTLSYLRGPMTREEIKKLSGTSSKAGGDETSATAGPPPPPVPAGFPAPAPAPSKADSAPPMLPADIPVFYLAGSGAGQGVAYQPAVIGGLRVHYSSSKYQISLTQPLWVIACLEEGPVPLDWDQAEAIALDPADLMRSPLAGCRFESLPQQALKPAAFRSWQKELLKWVRQSHPLEIYRSERLKMVSAPGESEAGFRTRLTQSAREQRDLETENLRRKYASRFTTLQNRELSMRLAMEREADQVKSQKVQTVISFGTAILGAFLGRKMVSGQSAQRMGSAMKSASRMGKEAMDVERARAKLEAVQAEIGDLEKQFQADMEQISTSLDPTNEPLETIRITARSTDIAVEAFGLVWMPFRTTAQGGRDPDWK
jgi:hypothetical protein